MTWVELAAAAAVVGVVTLALKAFKKEPGGFVPATIESPFWHTTPAYRIRNLRYAMLAQEWACKHTFAPYASHLIQTTHAQHHIDTGSPYVDDDHYGKYTSSAATPRSRRRWRSGGGCGAGCSSWTWASRPG